MIQIHEGQELQQKAQPQITILVCRIERKIAWCQCDDGYQRQFSYSCLDKFYKAVEPLAAAPEEVENEE